MVKVIADGMIMGVLPPCPECATRVKFEPITGQYKCPGYLNQNEVWVFCGFIGDNLERTANWKRDF